MPYLLADYQKLVNGVVVSIETVLVYKEYSSALSCNQAEASLTGLSESDTIAARATCALVAPVAPAGKVAKLRDCSGGTTGEQIEVIINDQDYVADPNNPGTTNPPTNADYTSTGDIVEYLQ